MAIVDVLRNRDAPTLLRLGTNSRRTNTLVRVMPGVDVIRVLYAHHITLVKHRAKISCGPTIRTAHYTLMFLVFARGT